MAAQWRNKRGISGKIPNIKDFASAEELVVLKLELLKKNQETLTVWKKNLIEDTETNS